MMKYLIVGHEGLIGTEIKKQIKGEYVGIDKGEEMPEENYDCIIHLGANCIIREVIKNPELAAENIKLNYEVLEFARMHNIKKVVYFSSSRVVCNQMNPYIASKVFGENLCKAYSDCYGIDYLIIRPETVWSMEDKHKRVITAWIEAAKEKRDIIVYGNRNKILSPIHVESFVSQFIPILEEFIDGKSKKNIYGISGMPQTAVEIIEKIRNKFNSNCKVFYKPAELTQPQEKVMQDIFIDDFDEYLERCE